MAATAFITTLNYEVKLQRSLADFGQKSEGFNNLLDGLGEGVTPAGSS